MEIKRDSEQHLGVGFLADHPALDLLNTLPMVNGERVDTLTSDADVRRWLAQAGFPVIGSLPSMLLSTVRSLRETLRTLVEARKEGRRVELATFNRFLKAAQSHPQVAWASSSSLVPQRVYASETAEELLAPLAESAADLLVKADFDLVRRCEDDSCVLWFYDQTKSHHRRWCSMATCGNRNKVAAYRKRRRKNTDPD